MRLTFSNDNWPYSIPNSIKEQILTLTVSVR